MTTEQWLAVSNYEGIYEVSDHGCVRSLERIVNAGGAGRGQTSQRQRTHPQTIYFETAFSSVRAWSIWS
jgi:hypothetical protein